VVAGGGICQSCTGDMPVVRNGDIVVWQFTEFIDYPPSHTATVWEGQVARHLALQFDPALKEPGVSVMRLVGGPLIVMM